MFDEALAETRRLIDRAVAERLDRFPPSTLVEAMCHATSGGKRLRAFLVLESARIHDVPSEAALPAALAVELIHAYSLVHDDLPCMDDDDLRRGQPTVHVKWDEATAVLVGDALQSLAFEVLAEPGLPAPAERRLALVHGLGKAAGASGMVLGQALDIAAETATEPLSLDDIRTLQAGKTGALIAWSATVGPVLSDSDAAPLARYAEALGLAFQIADDILDVTGDDRKAGKRLRKDAAARKATFVSILGLEGARKMAEDLADQAIAALSVYGTSAENLREAARFAISREM